MHGCEEFIMYGCEQTTDGRGRPSSLVLPRHSTSPSTPFTTTWQRPKCTECFRRVSSSGTLCSCVWGSGSSAGLWVTLALGCLFSESSRESKATRRCVRYRSYERVVGAASCIQGRQGRLLSVLLTPTCLHYSTSCLHQPLLPPPTICKL